VALLSPDELATCEEKGEENDEPKDSSVVPDNSLVHQSPSYCRYCYILFMNRCAIKSDDEAVYHMRAK
jgi:hypothetical protein